MDHEDPDEIRNHRSYKKASRIAETYKDNPDGLIDLVSDASKKAEGAMPRSFDDIREALGALFRMVKAYSTGEYREVPWKSIALIVGSLIYFISPIDLIPDFIPIIGLADDATLLAWTIKQLKTDIDAFRQWEEESKIMS
ncbi:MAG: YkvA family protein [Verrucomicrobiales bacterium]|nr:YkvA family protein [Verrucomicrobiales bacterium]